MSTQADCMVLKLGEIKELACPCCVRLFNSLHCKDILD